MIKAVDTMLKRTLLLSCRIVFDSMNHLGVSVQVHQPSISPDEYGRLWAVYHMKILESLGFPTNVDSLLASAIIEKIIAKPFSAKTDCFARAGLSEVVEYTESPLVGFPDMVGKYYEKEQRRFLLIDLPLDVTTKHLIYGGVGLLQYSLNRCGHDQDGRMLTYQTAKNVLFLLNPDSGYDTTNLSQVPDAAYTLAKRLYKQRKDGKDIEV